MRSDKLGLEKTDWLCWELFVSKGCAKEVFLHKRQWSLFQTAIQCNFLGVLAVLRTLPIVYGELYKTNNVLIQKLGSR